MIETTVTMGLHTFQQMESAEKTLFEMLNDRNRVLIKDEWRGFYSLPMNEASIELKNIVDNMAETKEHWRKESLKREKKGGFWS